MQSSLTALQTYVSDTVNKNRSIINFIKAAVVHIRGVPNEAAGQCIKLRSENKVLPSHIILA